MNQNIKIENTTREQIAEFLPKAIELAVKSYKDFMVETVPKKEFETHHKSAKVAISHIELLIKLAKWADLPDKNVEGDKDAEILAGLMATAEAELNAYQDEEK